jgi:hypothetical protein
MSSHPNPFQALQLAGAQSTTVIHVGVKCNGCGMPSIGGVRYKCLHCSDFDYCHVCEATLEHDRTHLFAKIRIPFPHAFNGHPRMCERPILDENLYELAAATSNDVHDSQ